jgi:Winged helix DNA-binding domain
VRLLRQRGHLLDRPRRTPVADVVRRLVGIQSQLSSAAALAVRARISGVVSGDVDAALQDDRSIVWTWAMRGTLHLVTSEDLGWLGPVTATTQLDGARRRLAQLGVTGDEPARAVGLIEAALAREGPLTRGAIAALLARRGIRTQGQAAIHLIRLSALEGVACYGPPRDSEPTFVLVRDWLPRAGSKRPRDPIAEIAARYLAAHGPATPEDLAAWSGLGLGEARRGWGAIARRLLEVELHGMRLWMLRSRATKDPPSGVVRLVPAFDPFLLGWKGRDLAVPAAHARKVFPGGGMLRAAVLRDGLAVGTWGTERRRGRTVIGVRPFARLAPAVRRSLAGEALDVGRFLGTTGELSVV